jgi:hypothetical protein
LWDYLGCEPSPALYQVFKSDVVAKFPFDVSVGPGAWTLTGDEVKAWLDEHQDLDFVVDG